MITPQYILDINEEIIVDNFAGGGGASTGIELALGRHVDVAINHDPEAVSMHQANHPQTVHHCESVWEVNPREVMPGRSIGLLWLSPDCKHHSKAKGGKPVEKNIRGLAWVALRWIAVRKPRVIMLENVEEFQKWGPLPKYQSQGASA
jgi:DNA (cytosine-5)-methyltransferase 1